MYYAIGRDRDGAVIKEASSRSYNVAWYQYILMIANPKGYASIEVVKKTKAGAEVIEHREIEGG